MRSHPAKHGEGFDAPPTLERRFRAPVKSLKGSQSTSYRFS